MSILTTDELQILTQEQIVHYINSGYLEERLLIFVQNNKLSTSNYEDEISKNNYELLSELDKTMRQMVEDEIIEMSALNKTIHLNFQKMKPWIDTLLKTEGVTIYSISHKERWDYCISSLLDMIGIKVIEKILKVM